MSSLAFRWLRKVVDVREGEVRAMFWACGCFFCILSCWYVLRPIRETMGVRQDVDKLPRLYWGTFFLTLAVTPLFSLLVNRTSRERFVPIVYHFFAANIGIFAWILWNVEGDTRIWVYRAFYIWSSMFTLFAVSVFWGLLADLLQDGQGKRLFGFVAAGGSLGAILGSFLSKDFVKHTGIEWLLLGAACLLEIAILCFFGLLRASRTFVRGEGPPPRAPDLVAAASGIRDVVRSRYLGALCLFMLLFTAGSTFLYFTQARIVDALGKNDRETVSTFAGIDLYVNGVSFLLQCFATGRIIRALGMPATMSVLPAVSCAGFAILAGAPALLAVMLFQVARRGADFAVSKPGRDLLFMVVPREQKYTSKSFIDTFVYRGGDLLASAAVTWLQSTTSNPVFSFSVAGLSCSLALLGVAWWLGREQERRAGLEVAR